MTAWLGTHIEGFRGDYAIEKFATGQSNPTYRLSAPNGDLVLRRKPFGKLLPKAHQVEREYRIQSALAVSGVPVPRMIALCEDAGIIGTAFYIMEFVEGRMFSNPRLPTVSRAKRGAMYDAMNATVAALHNVEPAAVGLGDYGRPEGFMRRQIALWTNQYKASQTRDIPAMDALAEWLPAHAPTANDAAIFHGDLRMDNMIFHPSEPRVVALLDWELSTLGDPLFDLAYQMHLWHFPPDLMNGMANADLVNLGIPTPVQYLESYCARTNRRVPENWTFYLAAAMFRIAAILQGIAKRVVDGNASAADGAELGAHAAPIAELAWDMVR